MYVGYVKIMPNEKQLVAIKTGAAKQVESICYN